MKAEDQLIEAARDEFSEFGIRRASMESVAKRAGVARATIYRRFSSKDELVATTFQAEARFFVSQLDEIWDGEGPLEDRAASTWIRALELLRENKLMNQLLRSDREAILPLMTVDGTVLLELVVELYAGLLRREVERGGLPKDADIQLAAEMLARTGISLALNPVSRLPSDDFEDARQFVSRYFIAPLRTAD